MHSAQNFGANNFVMTTFFGSGSKVRAIQTSDSVFLFEPCLSVRFAFYLGCSATGTIRNGHLEQKTMIFIKGPGCFY